MSLNPEAAVVDDAFTAQLRELNIEDIEPNANNPRLDFPQSELDRLADSIDQEGILVPIVVYPRGNSGKFVLVDGERRFKCATILGRATIPALITKERSEHDVLLQMFNIHLIREEWREIPTAKALQTLATEMEDVSGKDPSDREMADLTGLSVDRVRQLRYVVTLPDEWQDYIRQGVIPLNYFWELKKNILDALKVNRPGLLERFGAAAIQESFVQKRLDQVVTDTVSLRKMAPIIKFASKDAEASDDDSSTIDESIVDLIERRDATIDDAYEDTVQLMVEVDKLGKRTNSMLAVFARLLAQTSDSDDYDSVVTLGNQLISDLTSLLEASKKSD